MSYLYRLKRRIMAEGLKKTLQYIMCVCGFTIREFTLDIVLDMRYSRRLLKGNLKTSYQHLGANDVYHTQYSALPLIFRYVPINRRDVLVDVGCGKGRVINYWLCRGLKNKIIGLELDPRVAYQTAMQFAKRRNVTIITGDAIANLPSDGSIFYFYNPFSEAKVMEFEQRLYELFPHKPITIIYYRPKSLHVFQNGRWRIRFINFEKNLNKRRWGRINKYHDLAIIKNKCNNKSMSY